MPAAVEPEEIGLKQSLRGWQIFFILISGVVGSGIFTSAGSALEEAGPGGMLMALVTMGVIGIAVMEGVSELTQKFPAPNAIVEYVKTFVDEDLGLVVGLAYWYTWSSLFAVQNLAAAVLTRYWGITQTFEIIGFYTVAPLIILVINFVGVGTFGAVETVGGILKVILLLGTSVLLYVLNATGKGANESPINDGFRYNPEFVSNAGKGFCLAIPLMAFTFVGVELVAVSAFEAKYSNSLARPSRKITYIIFVLYLLCALGEALNVKWSDPNLPSVYGFHNPILLNPDSFDPGLKSTSVVVIAVWKAGHHTLAGFLNGCIIFSVLSASNTSLYIASRTLYGLTYRLPKGPGAHWITRKVAKLGIVVPRTGVPAYALVISWIAFFWLPFLQIVGGYGIDQLFQIMGVSASISCLLVWAALSLSYIRYRKWLYLCDSSLSIENSHLNRFKWDHPTYKAYTYLGFAQPIPAYFGLAGCIMVIGLTSATFWDSSVAFTKVAAAYATPIILAGVWMVLKLLRWWRGESIAWVKLDDDCSRLIRKLEGLEHIRRAERLNYSNGSPEMRSSSCEP